MTTNKKEYEVHLNLKADEVYMAATDPDFIINKLKGIYQGKCLHSSFISEIKKITRHSDMYCSKSRDDGSSDMDIIFEADAITYTNGDIISGCQIKTVESTGQILCRKDHTVARLEINRLVQSMGDNALIPVLVKSAYYQIGKAEITVGGEIFTPSSETIIYQLIADTPTADLILMLQQLTAKIDEKRVQIKNAPKPARDFFTDLFTPLKKQAPIPKKLVVDLQSLISTSGGITKWIVQHPTLYGTGQVYEINESDIPTWAHPVKGGTEKKKPNGKKEIPKEPKKEKDKIPKDKPLKDETKILSDGYSITLYRLLSEYLTHLQLIYEHTVLFPTQADIKKNQKCWIFYEKRKY